jgi:hypothetical protein
MTCESHKNDLLNEKLYWRSKEKGLRRRVKKHTKEVELKKLENLAAVVVLEEKKKELLDAVMIVENENRKLTKTLADHREFDLKELDVYAKEVEKGRLRIRSFRDELIKRVSLRKAEVKSSARKSSIREVRESSNPFMISDIYCTVACVVSYIFNQIFRNKKYKVTYPCYFKNFFLLFTSIYYFSNGNFIFLSFYSLIISFFCFITSSFSSAFYATHTSTT